MNKKNKMLFKCHTKYSKNNYNKFIHFHNNKFGLFYDVYTLLFLLLFIYCLVLGIKAKQLYTILIFSFLIIAFLSYRIFSPLFEYKKSTKSKTISKSQDIAFYFYEKNFKVREKNNFAKVRYWRLHKVYETDNFFYLYLTKKYAFLVDKKGFTQGSPEEFSKFIRNKLKFKYKLERSYN